MTITVEAVYENGVLKPTQPLPFPERQHLHVTVTPAPGSGEGGDMLVRSYGLLKWTGTHEELERILAECDEEDHL
jgi:predicted DNA-binding antitoxin AbrB/MazE fold protein